MMLYIKACNDHQVNIILGGAAADDGDYYGEDKILGPFDTADNLTPRTI